MKRPLVITLLICLLLCLMLGVGFWVGRVTVKPEVRTEYIYVDVPDTSYSAPATVMLDTVLIPNPVNAALLEKLNEKQDTIVFFKEYLQQLLTEEETDLIASHDTSISLGNTSFRQETTYEYKDEKFSFSYTNIKEKQVYVTPKPVPDISVGICMTSDLNALVYARYKWFVAGYKSDKSVFAGINISVKDIIR